MSTVFAKDNNRVPPTHIVTHFTRKYCALQIVESFTHYIAIKRPFDSGGGG